ncbi:aminotransferase class I/II-fold pyridoxal phosphate-dependent enzyme [Candidatus Parcubacteria bacterium]|nr:aminotransferase class I/II-fold pyridoxal phosphate-dependent enzyme [Patescibacteria group bacterium]MBU4309002.1 aminotransferase class I/II-fold pyridoxal phosphate-dependent enzyme [Patescibacteria group bacterium]MBU4432404.1 aminotransferase class I/II-fold pyridoxal phosphate-dependent enzyme [Patescibacteria group bacterium]MBU4577362.1 aminotransferase class I/II-fold pyridoxal phosphate-dependent enzyme [Patescibacteria group bacterium]MCG2697050.1 aminotransferase class I/II-fold
MQESKLPPGGQNLFQEIKKRVTAAEAAGQKIWRLGIGQPSGPALISARIAACQAVMKDDESMHEYQDNGSPGVPGFAQKFVNLHQVRLLDEGLAYLPIPGIKPMLGLIPMACGHVGFNDRGLTYKEVKVATMTSPGYPTPAVQCQYQCVENYALRTNTDNNFLFSPRDITKGTTLLMLNYPHNPSGQVATADYWEDICDYCDQKNIRIFNDAAYAMLTYNKDAATLASVAQHFPNLSWCEAYSASKVIANGTGWRIGAMVGSSDFIGDIATIKGNTDSGFFAPAAYGVLKCMQDDMESVLKNRDMYRDRNFLLHDLLEFRGMKLTVVPGAGFFSLWLAPSEAFGQKIQNAEQFNYLMIEKTGVVGVHFGPYIRYSVTSPIEQPEWQEAIANAFEQANVKY